MDETASTYSLSIIFNYSKHCNLDLKREQRLTTEQGLDQPQDRILIKFNGQTNDRHAYQQNNQSKLLPGPALTHDGGHNVAVVFVVTNKQLD